MATPWNGGLRRRRRRAQAEVEGVAVLSERVAFGMLPAALFALLSLPNPDVLSRSHAERPPKLARQVRLIRKTSGQRSIGDREPFSQQSLRASNPQLLKICMWWETDMMLERPYQLERAE